VTDLKPIDFAPPDIGEAERRAVDDVLRSGWITSGMHARSLSDEIADLTGRPAAVTSSATLGLQALLLAGKWGRGDLAIFPVITFPGMPMQCLNAGMDVAFVDVDGDCLMDPDQAAEAAARHTHRRVLLVPTHMMGAVMDMHTLVRKQIDQVVGMMTVIEDCAHLYPGMDIDGSERRVGDCLWSCASIFSFYPTKCVATCEGGAVTYNPALISGLGSAIWHGMDRTADDRYRAGGTTMYEIVRPGTKANMSDVAAAIARVQLQRRQELRGRRETVATWYSIGLRQCGYRVYQSAQRGTRRHSQHLMVVDVPHSRDRVRERMAADGVATSIHFRPVTEHPFFRGHPGVWKHGPCENGWKYGQHALSLPLHPNMKMDDVERVLHSFDRAVRR